MNKTLDQMQKELEKTLQRLQENNVDPKDFFKIKQMELDAKLEEEMWAVIPDISQDYLN